MPGDTVTFKVKLLVTYRHGRRSTPIREGGRTVGAGVVTKITKIIIALYSARHALYGRPGKTYKIYTEKYPHLCLRVFLVLVSKVA